VAAWHHESPVRQSALQKSAQYIVNRPAGEADHPHPARNEPSLHRRRNRTADEDAGPEAQEFANTSNRIRSGHRSLFSPDLLFILNVNQQQIAGDIEHGGDSPLPLWNRDPHHRHLKHSACRNRQVILAAGGLGTFVECESCNLHFWKACAVQSATV
jgi:hypothetical protein